MEILGVTTKQMKRGLNYNGTQRWVIKTYV